MGSSNSIVAVKENLPIALGIATLEGKILYYNKAFTELFGYTLQDTPDFHAFKKKLFISETYANEQFELWERTVKEAITQGNTSSARMVGTELKRHIGAIHEAISLNNRSGGRSWIFLPG